MLATCGAIGFAVLAFVLAVPLIGLWLALALLLAGAMLGHLIARRLRR